jgi:hypothetical protein
MQTVPHGTRYLIVACSEPSDPQFRGIQEAGDLLGRLPQALKFPWNGKALALERRKVLRWILISGHGAEESARLSDGRNNALTPGDLLLPKGCGLYLLGCYQGKEYLKSQWAEATGGDHKRIHGCGGETESALSTLLLLNLLDDGPETIAHWFSRWIEVNDYLRSWFLIMRRTYREKRMDFLSSLKDIEGRVDLAPVEDFVSVGKRYPELLSNLG